MSDQRVYHVLPAPREAGWAIKVEGKARAETVYQSRVEALSEVRRLARANPGHQFVVHHWDGSVDEASTLECCGAV